MRPDAGTRPGSSGSSPAALVASGVALVGVAFGLARYGYGLLLPEIRTELGLDRGTLGLIGSTAYVSYLLATTAVDRLVARLGLRGTATVGGLLATGGMAMIAAAPGVALLAVGVFVAGAAPALVWPPYLDAVERRLPEGRRDAGHGYVNSGTAYGVALAAPVALAVGAQWRLAWVVFAVCAAAATAWAARQLPGRRASGDAPAPGVAALRGRTGTAPLIASTFTLGLSGGAYWTFGVDAVVSGALLEPAGGQAFQIVVGLSGAAGGFAGRLVQARGARVVLVTLVAALAASHVLLAVATGPAATITSAMMFGAGYIGAVGVTAIWSTRIFPDRPSSGLSVAMFSMGLGLVLGPAAAGLLADRVGLGVVFLLAAGVTVCVAPLAGRIPPRGANV